MKTALCTISANNFLPYGLDCLLSNKKYNNYDYYYLIADDFKENLYVDYNKDITFVKLTDLGIEREALIDMEFKYTIVEFNTSVKPAFYKFLFSKGYDNVIYLDPDIESYSNFSYLDSLLKQNNIVLTPHKCTSVQSTFFRDNDFLNNGIYNFGFIAMHKSEQTDLFLEWWDSALRNACYLDYSNGMATDQIWGNLVPVYFDGVYISKHPGMNLAFWNIDERKIQINDKINVNEQELLFIHFSSLSIGCNDELLKIIYNISPEFKYIYENHIKSVQSYKYTEYSKIPYKYNNYQNGVFISKEERRLFGFAKLNKSYINPFETVKKSYYNDLRNNKIRFSIKIFNKNEKKLAMLIKFFGIKKILKISRYLSAFNERHISQLYVN